MLLIKIGIGELFDRHLCKLVVNGYTVIFTFNKHFDKENDCVHEPVITKPHHWRRLFITFYIVNFLLFKKKLDLPYEVDYHMCRQVN